MRVEDYERETWLAAAYAELRERHPLARPGDENLSEWLRAAANDRAASVGKRIEDGRSGAIDQYRRELNRERASQGVAGVDLSDEVRGMLAELAPTGRTLQDLHMVSGRPSQLPAGCNIAVIAGGDQMVEAEAFVYESYLSLGYTAESGRKLVTELAPFAERSRFHAALDPSGKIIGVVRLIFGSFDTLPVGRFTRVDFLDDEPMAELSSFVIDPQVGATGVFEHLWRAAWADAVTSGAHTIAQLGERWVLDLLRDRFALPFVPSGIPEYYMGSEVMPMTMATRPRAMSETAQHNPEFWLWILESLTHEQVAELGYEATVDLAQSRMDAFSRQG